MSVSKIKEVTLVGKENWDDWIKYISGNTPSRIWQAVNPFVRTRQLADEPDHPTASDYRDEAVNYLDLDTDEKRAYDHDLSDWKELTRIYENERKEVEATYSLVFNHVSHALQQGLDRGNSLDEWFDYLQIEAQPAEGFMINKMQIEYQEILKAFRTEKNLPTWLNGWETFMIKASRYSLPELEGGRWLRDIASLIESIQQSYATSFRDAAEQMGKDRKMVHEKQEEIQDALETLNPLQAAVAPSAATITAFNTAIAAARFVKENERQIKPLTATTWNVAKVAGTLKEWALDNPKELKARTGPSRGSVLHAGNEDKSNGSQKKRKTNGDPCEACGTDRHELKGCWSVFPELRPAHIPAYPRKEKEAQDRVDNDPELKAKVDAIRKNMNNPSK